MVTWIGNTSTLLCGFIWKVCKVNVLSVFMKSQKVLLLMLACKEFKYVSRVDTDIG